MGSSIIEPQAMVWSRDDIVWRCPRCRGAVKNPTRHHLFACRHAASRNARQFVFQELLEHFNYLENETAICDIIFTFIEATNERYTEPTEEQECEIFKLFLCPQLYQPDITQYHVKLLTTYIIMLAAFNIPHLFKQLQPDHWWPLPGSEWQIDMQDRLNKPEFVIKSHPLRKTLVLDKIYDTDSKSDREISNDILKANMGTALQRRTIKFYQENALQYIFDILKAHPDWVIVLCDGSFTPAYYDPKDSSLDKPTEVGAGLSIQFHDHAIFEAAITFTKTSIATAELSAIFNSIHILSRHKRILPGTKILILTDNMFSQKSIAGIYRPTKYNNNHLLAATKKALTILRRTHQVKIKWIPAHVGYIAHNRADTLAKEGACANYTQINPATPIQDFYNGICCNTLKKHNQQNYIQTQQLINTNENNTTNQIVSTQTSNLQKQLQLIYRNQAATNHTHKNSLQAPNINSKHSQKKNIHNSAHKNQNNNRKSDKREIDDDSSISDTSLHPENLSDNDQKNIVEDTITYESDIKMYPIGVAPVSAAPQAHLQDIAVQTHLTVQNNNNNIASTPQADTSIQQADNSLARNDHCGS